MSIPQQKATVRRTVKGKEQPAVPEIVSHSAKEAPLQSERYGRIFRLVGSSGDLVPVGIKVRAKTQPNP